ncbi:MAG: bacillithiol biosynthesis deacetylase BshB1 [Planctomycetes bacterium]|nr:bacillithiol biosynthesis deacetylase BshB1 [Planctomycetota bacterium]MCB9870268.1 bacillithiol biosynthesis deacetylase BshB1 [Planctomycetota bacterium]MCB9888152.1 bacillithiol biosynthesis deacetylase BshB1 [Planctomycetota bacterium]
MNTEPLDVLVLAAHPDDAEIGCGGTLLALRAAGRRFGIADMTEGEKGTAGTVESRRTECAAATRLLGDPPRINLKLPDTALRDDDQALAAVVGVIRALRPRVLLAMVPHDVHPDHVATGLVAERAFFHSGLVNYRADLGAPFRPERLVQYLNNDHLEPSFCVDISAYVADKRALIECYATQVGGPDTAHFARKVNPLERIEARDRYFGIQTGCRAAEPFMVRGPLRLSGFEPLL